MRVLAVFLALLGAFPACAGTLGSVGYAVQAPPVVERLHNVGGLIYDRNGNQVQLRGFNTDTDSVGFEEIDAATVQAMGGNVIRWTPAWYADNQNGGTCTPGTGPGMGATFNGTISTTSGLSVSGQVGSINYHSVITGLGVLPTTQVTGPAVGGYYPVFPPQNVSGPEAMSTACIWPQNNDAFFPPAAWTPPSVMTAAANGYFDPTILKQTDDQVAAATSRHIWIMIGFSTGGGDFTTNAEGAWSGGANANATVQGYYYTMLKFMAARYMNTPYIACYELWTEPRAITSDSGSRYRNDIVAAIEVQAIAAIRTVDQITPICIGPAAGYDVRANFNMIGPFNPVLGSNVWVMNDWYELAGVVGGIYTGYTHQFKPITVGSCAPPNPPCAPLSTGANFMGSISGTALMTSGESGTIGIGAIVKGAGVAIPTQITGGSIHNWMVAPSQMVTTSEPMFTGYTTYPDTYQDVSLSQSYATAPGCLYPPNNSYASLPVQMTGGNPNPPIVPGTVTTFLAGLDDSCAVAWTKLTGVPVVMEQVGLTTVTPGAWQYDSDQLDMMNSRHQSYMIWVLRNSAHSVSPGDGIHAGSSGSQGLYYQDGGNVWWLKDITYHCPAIDQVNQSYLMIESVSTCDDYYDMFSYKFKAPP